MYLLRPHFSFLAPDTQYIFVALLCQSEKQKSDQSTCKLYNLHHTAVQRDDRNAETTHTTDQLPLLESDASNTGVRAVQLALLCN